MWKLMLITIGALSLIATTARAENKEQWGFIRYDRYVLLFYGVPESEAGTLYFACEPKKKVSIITPVMRPRAKIGDAGRIKLTNGPASQEYVGKAVRENEDDGIQFEAETPINPRIFTLL